jgi:hypothetical protein
MPGGSKRRTVALVRALRGVGHARGGRNRHCRGDEIPAGCDRVIGCDDRRGGECDCNSNSMTFFS